MFEFTATDANAYIASVAKKYDGDTNRIIVNVCAAAVLFYLRSERASVRGMRNAITATLSDVGKAAIAAAMTGAANFIGEATPGGKPQGVHFLRLTDPDTGIFAKHGNEPLSLAKARDILAAAMVGNIVADENNPVPAMAHSWGKFASMVAKPKTDKPVIAGLADLKALEKVQTYILKAELSDAMLARLALHIEALQDGREAEAAKLDRANREAAQKIDNAQEDRMIAAEARDLVTTYADGGTLHEAGPLAGTAAAA